MNPSKFSVISHVLPLFCHSLVCDFRENCLRIVNAALSAPALRSAPCFPRPFFRAQKTAARGSPPREAASVPAACSKRRGALRGSTGARANVTPARAGKGSRTRWSRSWHTDRPRPCGECLLGPPFSVPRSDHPRIRGEKNVEIADDNIKAGLPPHTRGKSALPPDGNLSLRSTPAHAGNCSVLRKPGRNAAPRITPARAGKRRPSHVYSQPFWDHPCLCTEKICYEAPEDEKNGSPPPMRGKVSIDITTISSYRITPAHARKSPQCQTMRSKGQDHPRVCGEKLEPVYQVAAVLGSPPPVRGKAPCGRFPAAPGRITPACAGKSQLLAGGVLGQLDHPRLCGEKHGFAEISFRRPGSPPPVRGKVDLLAHLVELVGITPACAGKRT